MSVVMWVAWIILIPQSALCLYGLYGIVRMRRLGDRDRLKNLLWAELTLGLFVSGLVTAIGTHGRDRGISQSLMSLGLLIQAVRLLLAARKPGEAEPPAA